MQIDVCNDENANEAAEVANTSTVGWIVSVLFIASPCIVCFKANRLPANQGRTEQLRLKRRPRVEAEDSIADNVPHCDQALNVDSVLQ